MCDPVIIDIVNLRLYVPPIDPQKIVDVKSKICDLSKVVCNVNRLLTCHPKVEVLIIDRLRPHGSSGALAALPSS